MQESIEQPWFFNVETVHRRLIDAYQPTDLGNKADPFDELVFIVLSTQTREEHYERAFERVRDLVAEWDRLPEVDETALKEAIGSAGLNTKKARSLRTTATALREGTGSVSLDYLRELETPEAEADLLSLPGVGLKVAKCVLLYALGRFVFPVDIHCARIAVRLGWLPETSRLKSPTPRQAREYEASVPPALRGGLHVKFVQHGRQTCTARAPLCSECVLLDLCDYGQYAGLFA